MMMLFTTAILSHSFFLSPERIMYAGAVLSGCSQAPAKKSGLWSLVRVAARRCRVRRRIRLISSSGLNAAFARRLRAQRASPRPH
jgi:hypothetical protein